MRFCIQAFQVDCKPLEIVCCRDETKETSAARAMISAPASASSLATSILLKLAVDALPRMCTPMAVALQALCLAKVKSTESEDSSIRRDVVQKTDWESLGMLLKMRIN